MSALAGKVAVVTGGSRGIGRAVAERLARDGAAVVLTYLQREELALQVVAGIEAVGGRAAAIAVDLTRPSDVERVLAAAEARFGGVDILVNNAAELRIATLLETSLADWERALAVNVTAPFVAIKAAARCLRDDGRIINVSTINTVLAEPGVGAYAASKGALEQLTRVAAHELAARGITVNAVSPGPVDTELLRAVNPPEALEQAVAMTPLRRLGRPADVADVVAFLVGPDARWITGQNLRVTGGLA